MGALWWNLAVIRDSDGGILTELREFVREFEFENS